MVAIRDETSALGAPGEADRVLRRRRGAKILPEGDPEGMRAQALEKSRRRSFKRRCLELATRIAGPALGLSPGRRKRRGPLDGPYTPIANTGGEGWPGAEMAFEGWAEGVWSPSGTRSQPVE